MTDQGSPGLCNSVYQSEFRNAVLGWAGGRGDDGGAGQYSRFLNISSVHNMQKPFLHLVPEETWQPDTCTCLVSGVCVPRGRGHGRLVSAAGWAVPAEDLHKQGHVQPAPVRSTPAQ